jgi:hypothetical protein
MKKQDIVESATSSTEIEHEERLPKYESPKIEVHNEEELLQNVAVLGCYPFPP